MFRTQVPIPSQNNESSFGFSSSMANRYDLVAMLVVISSYTYNPPENERFESIFIYSVVERRRSD